MRRDKTLIKSRILILLFAVTVSDCTESAGYVIDESLSLCPEQVLSARLDPVDRRVEWLLVKVSDFPIQITKPRVSDSTKAYSTVVELRKLDPGLGYGFSLAQLEMNRPTTFKVADLAGTVFHMSEAESEQAVTVREYFMEANQNDAEDKRRTRALSDARHYASCVSIPGQPDSCEGWFRVLDGNYVAKFTFLEDAVLEFDWLTNRIEEQLNDWICE